MIFYFRGLHMILGPNISIQGAMFLSRVPNARPGSKVSLQDPESPSKAKMCPSPFF